MARLKLLEHVYMYDWEHQWGRKTLTQLALLIKALRGVSAPHQFEVWTLALGKWLRLTLILLLLAMTRRWWTTRSPRRTGAGWGARRSAVRRRSESALTVPLPFHRAAPAQPKTRSSLLSLSLLIRNKTLVLVFLVLWMAPVVRAAPPQVVAPGVSVWAANVNGVGSKFPVDLVTDFVHKFLPSVFVH